MDKLFIQGLILVFFWIGAWGILDMTVTAIAGDDRQLRASMYVILLLLGLLLVWMIEVAFN